MPKKLTKAQQLALDEQARKDLEWKNSRAASAYAHEVAIQSLDRRIKNAEAACPAGLPDRPYRTGSDLSMTRGPNGFYQQAHSAEDAWLISCGRGDLVR